MILLFEGPDGAGKSTMIKAVAAEHLAAGYPLESTAIWRAGPFPQDSDPWTEYVLPLMSLSASRDWLVLVDRWHVGELVYGPIFRGGSRLSEDQRTWIDGFLRSMGGVLVAPPPSGKVLPGQRMSKRSGMSGLLIRKPTSVLGTFSSVARPSLPVTAAATSGTRSAS